MNKTYKTVGAVLASVMFLATAAAVLAAPPSPGDTGMIYGDLTVDGDTAVGYQVTAKTDGESWSDTTDDTGQYVLEIPATYDTVDLYVAGTSVKSGVTVPPGGDDKRVDLSVSSAELTELPTADAGADTSVDEGSSVGLDGTGSTDPDGYIETWSWSITSDPTGGASLSGADTDSPTFEAPADVSADTDVTVQLEVTDNAGAVDTDTVTVTVKNVPTGDTTAPTISNVSVSTTTTTATITWTTDEPATSEVEHDGTTRVDETLTTSHSVPLSGLEPGTEYSFDLTSEDEAGNVSDAYSGSFTTSAEEHRRGRDVIGRYF